MTKNEQNKVLLTRWQTKVWDDPHRYKVVNAGRRSGKSYLVTLKAIDFAVRNEGSIVWYVAPTYRQAKQIAWEMINDLIPRRAVQKKNETELKILLKNGSKIELKGADNADSLRGVRIDLCIFDECAFIDRWSTVWKVIRPTLMDSKADVWFISTPNGFNHFKDLAENQNEDWQYFHYTTYDNPHIDPKEIGEMKDNMTESAFAQEVMGRFTKKSGLVYPMFSRKIHVREFDLDDFKPVMWIRGADKGFRNPSAVAIIAVNADGQWYQVDELYERKLINPDLFEKVNTMSSKWLDHKQTFEMETMDSAQAGDIVELNQMGHNWLPVKKQSGESNKNYVRWKIQKFTERLEMQEDGEPSYFVHPSCLSTIEEFEKYSWKEDKDDQQPEENPEKLYDHMMDALADLNAMYIHHYEEKVRKPWHGKIKGTYVPPSPGNQEEDKNDFTSERVEDYWDLDRQL